LSGPLKKVFSVGQPIKLVEKGIDAVTRWYSKLDHKMMESVALGILPCLKHFMSESCSEMLEESAHLVEARKLKRTRKEVRFFFALKKNTLWSLKNKLAFVNHYQ
jgi:hypothetical protein